MKYPAWFQPHHKSLNERLDRLDETQRLILQATQELILATERVLKMSGTIDQTITDLTALEHAHAAALAKLQSDVTAALGRISSGGPLTAAQQAEVDALKGAMAADTATVEAIDASTQPAAPAAP